MTNVLYLHTTSEIGGSDISLARLVERLSRDAFTPIVVLPADGPLVPRLAAAGARVILMPEMRKLTSRRGKGYLVRFALSYPRTVWRIARLIRRERIGLVHTNTIHNLYGCAAARLAGVPHVWHVREIVWQFRTLRAIELWLARHLSTRVIVTSDGVAAMFGDRRRWPTNLVKVSNGVEADVFTPGDGGPVRREMGVPPAVPLVGIVCRLDDWKGVDVFLDAAAIVAARHPAAHFAVVGGPIAGQEEYGAALRARASRLGLDGRVHFTDWRYGPADMPAVHRALDVLVLASKEPEAFGLVLLEAMATGNPVVATAPGGPGEIVVDGETGWLVPPSDVAATAAAIGRLLDDPDRARAMGAAGRRRVLALYTTERYVAGVEAVYRDVLAIRAHDHM